MFELLESKKNFNFNFFMCADLCKDVEFLKEFNSDVENAIAPQKHVVLKEIVFSLERVCKNRRVRKCWQGQSKHTLFVERSVSTVLVGTFDAPNYEV